jgi:hypothetical protein
VSVISSAMLYMPINNMTDKNAPKNLPSLSMSPP